MDALSLRKLYSLGSEMTHLFYPGRTRRYSSIKTNNKKVQKKCSEPGACIFLLLKKIEFLGRCLSKPYYLHTFLSGLGIKEPKRVNRARSVNQASQEVESGRSQVQSLPWDTEQV